KPIADSAKNAPETSPSNAGRRLPRPAAAAGSTDISTTPSVASITATMPASDSGSPSTAKPNKATWTGSVLVHAVTTTNERSRMAASISAVAAIWASAPPRTNPANSRLPPGTGSPPTASTTPRNSSANGKPNRKRTCVAPSVPSVAVRLRCTALRPACAAAAKIVAGIQTQVQSMTAAWRSGALGHVRHRRAGHAGQLLRTEAEHRMRVAGGGPQRVELEQVLVEQHDGLDDMADGADAADGVAGHVAHEARVRLGEFSYQAGHLGFVHAVHAAGDDQHRRIVGAPAENDGLGDLRDLAAQALGGLGGGLAALRQHDDGMLVAQVLQQAGHALRRLGQGQGVFSGHA